MRRIVALLLLAWTATGDEIEEAIKTLQDKARPDKERLVALDELTAAIKDKHPEQTKAFFGILRSLTHGSPAVRVAILNWIRKRFPDPKLARVMIHFLNPDAMSPPERVAALRALARVAKDAALPLLVTALDDDAEDVRFTASEELGRLCRGKDDVRGYLYSEEGGTRLAAAFAKLGELVGPDSTAWSIVLAPALAALMVDPRLPEPAFRAAHVLLTEHALEWVEDADGRAAVTAKLRHRLAGKDVISVIEKLPDTGLVEQFTFMRWMNGALLPLRAGHKAILAGKAKRLERSAAYKRLHAADVILIGDIHGIDPCRAALIQAFDDLKEGRECAFALEAIPQPWEMQVGALRKEGDGNRIRDFLKKAWPFPIESYLAVLRCDATVLAVGYAAPREVPPKDTPDRKRVARPRVGTPGDFKYGASWFARNGYTAKRVSAWLKEKPGKRRVFVLYGAAHFLDNHGIKTLLDKQGVKTVMLMPFLPDWEIALRKKFGRRAAAGWFEILPGVLVPPYVGDEDARQLR